MEKIIEEQLIRSDHLKTCLDIAKIINNPEAEHLISVLKTRVDKAEELLEKRKNLIEEKDKLRSKLRDLTKECNERSHKIEQIIQHNNEQSNISTDLGASYNQVSEKVNNVLQSNFLDVSPCPAEWANGALSTPGPQCSSQSPSSFAEESQNQYIKFIDTEELRTTPTYMKGRLSCDDVNSFIDTLNCVLKKKYAILNLKRKEVKRKDLIQYSDWKSQEMEHKMIGKIYFTAEDLLTLGNTKIDKAKDKIIQVLRHTGRLRQSQVNKKLVLYIVI